MGTIEERVKAGATLLDSRVVGWAGKVRPENLRMDDCLGCMLGQVFGSYTEGCDELGITAWARSQAVEFGFHSASDRTGEELNAMCCSDHDALVFAERAEYAALKSAWLAEIDARLCAEAIVDETESSPVAVEDSPL